MRNDPTMKRWKITIEAWPFSQVSQELAGKRSNDYPVRAEDMADAFRQAEAIAMGVRANPAVWRAPITAIVGESDLTVDCKTTAE